MSSPAIAASYYLPHQLVWRVASTGMSVPVLEPIVSPPPLVGRLTVVLLRAKRLYDVNIVSKMAPFVECKVGDTRQKSSVQKTGHTDPDWSGDNNQGERMEFLLKGDDNVIRLRVFHKTLLGETLIGTARLLLNSLLLLHARSAAGTMLDSPTNCANPSLNELWVDIGRGDKQCEPAGSVYISVHFELAKPQRVGGLLANTSMPPSMSAARAQTFVLTPDPVGRAVVHASASQQAAGIDVMSPMSPSQPHPRGHPQPPIPGSNLSASAPMPVGTPANDRSGSSSNLGVDKSASLERANSEREASKNTPEPSLSKSPTPSIDPSASSSAPAPGSPFSLKKGKAASSAASGGNGSLTAPLVPGVLPLPPVNSSPKTSVIQVVSRPKLFGGTLANGMARSKDSVPVVVFICISYLSHQGLKAVGLFRISSQAEAQESLKRAFEAGSSIELSDPHTTADVLKSYFRQLSDPLIPSAVFTNFLAATDFSNEEESIGQLRQLLQALPEDNYNVLSYLLHFLTLVAAESDINKMNAANCALVWSPNILRKSASQQAAAAATDTQASMAKEMRKAEDCIHLLIKNYQRCFPEGPPTPFQRKKQQPAAAAAAVAPARSEAPGGPIEVVKPATPSPGEEPGEPGE